MHVYNIIIEDKTKEERGIMARMVFWSCVYILHFTLLLDAPFEVQILVLITMDSLSDITIVFSFRGEVVQ